MSAVRPMTPSEYDAWLVTAIPVYAADKVASGQWVAEEAMDLSRKEYDDLLPLGLATPENHFFTVVDSRSAAVGTLWFAAKTKGDARIAYVFDVSVLPERRREGHALRAFLALEGEVRRLGLSGIALHVFGHNTGAQSLYARLGFRPTNITLFKPVGRGRVRDAPAASKKRPTAVHDLRSMTLADHDAVIELMQKTPGVSIRDADSRESTARYLDRNPGLNFVARVGGQVVGCVMCGHDGRRGYLQHLVVLPEFRRRGIANALVQSCLLELERLGILKCHLDVFKTNARAQAYWESQGWTLRTDIHRYSFIRSGGENI